MTGQLTRRLTGQRGGVGRWIVVGVLVLAVAATVFALVRRNRAPDLQRTLVERVEQGAFSREVSGTGVVEARTERELRFKTSGTVQELLVAEGDEVEAGTVLARLDTAAAERDLASSRANLQSARADLNRLGAQQQVDRIDTQSAVSTAQDALTTAQEALADAQRNLATTQRLFDTGAASQNELTMAQEAFASAQRRLGSAELSLQSAQTRQGSFGDLAAAQRSSVEAQISQLQTTIANLEESLAEASLSAPFSGTVAAIGFDVGDTVGAGQGQSLSLVDTSSLYVSANFDENRASELRQGQSASVTPDADADQRLEASVRRVGTVANRSSGTAQLEADLVFDDPDEAVTLVRPGYTVTARVQVNAEDDVLLIPLEAITEEGDESFVYRVSEDEPGEGSTERSSVRVLDRNATIAAAESDELRAGDLIAVINIDELEAGAGVRYDPLEDESTDTGDTDTETDGER